MPSSESLQPPSAGTDVAQKPHRDAVTLSGGSPEVTLEGDPVPRDAAMRKAASVDICCQSSQHRRPL